MTEDKDGFFAAMLATGCFQEHPDGSLATDMGIREARSAAYTMPDPRRPCVVRCRDGVLLCAPPRAGARDLHLRQAGWYVAVAPESGAVFAWRKAEPSPPPAWRRCVEGARDQLMSRLSPLPPQAVLGVVARHGGGGVDEIAAVLSPSADAGGEALALCSDIEAGGRTFLVDVFRGSVPAGFAPVPPAPASDKVSPPRRPGSERRR
jgi:hypothetical protein